MQINQNKVIGNIAVINSTKVKTVKNSKITNTGVPSVGANLYTTIPVINCLRIYG